MPILLDHDPVTGVTQYFDYDPIKDLIHITDVQDCSAILNQNAVLRNDESYSKNGIKEDWWHYATIPTIVEMQLKKKGIDIYNKDHTKALLREINTNYPYLKVTEKRHA